MKPITLMRLAKISTPQEIKHQPQKLWVEPKHDGFLTQTIIDGDTKIYTRKGTEITKNIPALTELINKLDLPQETILLGELLWFDENGKQSETTISSIAGSLPNEALRKQKELKGYPAIVYYDILWKEGKDITKQPFKQRRKELVSLLKGKTNKQLFLSPLYTFDNWEKAVKDSLARGGEGIVVKNIDSEYIYKALGEREPKPSNTWWKWKPHEKAMTDDFVVYKSMRSEKGRLIVSIGQYAQNTLYDIGKLDGFSRDNEDNIEKRLRDGKFVIEVGFEERTADGRLRHPHFERFRDDKRKEDVDRSS